MVKNYLYLLRNLVSRDELKSLIFFCYLVGIILVGIGAELIAQSSFFETLLAFLIVGFISTIFYIYERLYQMGSKEFCLIIKFFFLLFLFCFFLVLLGLIWSSFKWGFYMLLLAKVFIAVGIMITFYLGLTLKKAPSLDLSDTFWA